MTRYKATAVFTLGFITWASGAMAVLIYGFDLYERVWGRWPSYQVALWIVTVAAMIVAIGFYFGTSRLDSSLPWWKPLFISGAFTLVFGMLAFLAGYLGYLGVSQGPRLLFFGLLLFISSFFAAKLHSWHAIAASPQRNRTRADDGAG